MSNRPLRIFLRFLAVNLLLLGQGCNDPSAPSNQNQSGSATIVVSMQTSATITAGSCVPVQVTLSGNSSSSLPISYQNLGQASLYINSACSQGVPASGWVVPAGVSSYSFFLSDNVVEQIDSNFSVNGQTIPLSILVNATTAAKFIVQNANALTFTAGSPAPISVVAYDSHGNPSAITQAATLVTSDSHGTFCSDSGCNTIISQIQFQNSSQITFYYKSTTSGQDLITINDPNQEIASGSATVTINGSQPVALSFATATKSQTVGSCAAYNIGLIDAYGNSTQATAPLSISIQASSQNMGEYNANCVTPTTTFALSVGASSVTISVKDDTAELGTLTASTSTPGITGTSISLTFTAGNANKLVFAKAPSSVSVFACSSQFQIGVQDSFGNQTTVSQSTVVTVAGFGQGVFFADAACSTAISSVTIPTAGNAVSFYVSDDYLENFLINANAGSLISAPQTAITVAPPPTLSLAGGAALTLAVDPTISGAYYVGGSFSLIGGVARNNVAHILADGSVDPNWNPGVSCAPQIICNVTSIIVSGSTVFLAGDFDTVGGLSRNNLAAVNAANGVVLAWNPNPNNLVNTMAISGNAIYFGGSFTSVGSVARSFAAAVDTSGNLLPWSPNLNGEVLVLGVNGGDIVLSGYFPPGNVVAVDGSSGSHVWWSGTTNGFGYALGFIGNTAYVGGNFPNIAVMSINDTGGSLNTNFNGGSVNAIFVSGSTLYLGGSFTTTNGSPQKYAYALNTVNGGAYLSLATPPGVVASLMVSGPLVYFGGYGYVMAAPVPLN
jgi:hypothetical protein